MNPGDPVLHFYKGEYYNAYVVTSPQRGRNKYNIQYEDGSFRNGVHIKYLYTYLHIGERVSYRTPSGQLVPAIIVDFDEINGLYYIDGEELGPRSGIERSELVTCEEMAKNVHGVDCREYDKYPPGEEGHARIRDIILAGPSSKRDKLMDSIKKCIEIRKNFISQCLYKSQPIDRKDFWNQLINTIDMLANPIIDQSRRSPTSRASTTSQIYRDTLSLLKNEMQGNLFYKQTLRDQDMPVDLTGYAEPDLNHEWTIYLLWKYIKEYEEQEKKEKKQQQKEERVRERDIREQKQVAAIRERWAEEDAAKLAAAMELSKRTTGESEKQKLERERIELDLQIQDLADSLGLPRLSPSVSSLNKDELERERRDLELEIQILSDPAYMDLSSEQRQAIFKAVKARNLRL